MKRIINRRQRRIESGITSQRKYNNRKSTSGRSIQLIIDKKTGKEKYIYHH